MKRMFFVVALAMIGGFVFIGGVSADSTVLYEDGTFIINEQDQDRISNTESHGTVTKEYEAFDGSNYVFDNSLVLWDAEKDSIKRVEIAQKIKPKSIINWFNSMANLEYIDFTNLDTSDITDMNHLLYESATKSSSLELKNIGSLDTSKVTDMSAIFSDIRNSKISLNLDLSKWNTSSVTNMSYMFGDNYLKSLTVNVFGWDTTNVTDMSGMFIGVDHDYAYPIVIDGDFVIPSGCNIDSMLMWAENLSGNFVFSGDFTGNMFQNNDTAINDDARIGLFSTSDTSKAKLESLVIDSSSHIYVNPYRIIADYAEGILINGKEYANSIAQAGDVIKVASVDGYIIKSISVVKSSNDETVSFDYDNDTFVMPDSDVNIDVTYVVKPSVGKVILNKPQLIDYNNIKVSWSEVEGADGYRVSLHDSTHIGPIASYDIKDLSYEFNDLNENYDSYEVFVRAYKNVDVDGHTKVFEGQSANTASLRTSKELAAPLVSAKLIGIADVKLEWNSIDDAEGYNIYYKKSSSDEYKFLHETMNTYYEVEGLSNSAEYDFKVVPVTKFINLSADWYLSSGYDSDYVFESKLFGTSSITTLANPDVGSVTIEDVSYNSKRITWESGSSLKYKIYYKSVNDEEYNYVDTVSRGEYVFKNLPSSYRYDVKIVPYIVVDGNEFEGLSHIFEIESYGYDIGNAEVRGISNKTYNGKYQTQNIRLVLDGKTLVSGRDYEVSYKNNRNAGVATVIIIGKGSYSGEMAWTFKIKPLNIKSVQLSNYVYSYNGYLKTPIVTVKNGYGNVLAKDINYSLVYQTGRKNVGTYRVTVKGKGNYTGTIVKTFKIIPISTNITKISRGKTSIKVNYNKRIYQVSGYQIRVSSSSKMTNARYVKIGSYKTNNKTIKSLKRHKRYYVQIRTYKKTVSGTYYSSWSSIRSVVTL